MDPSGNNVVQPFICFCKPCQIKRPLPKLIKIKDLPKTT